MNCQAARNSLEIELLKLSINTFQGRSQYLREWGTVRSFFSLSDGFLPKSSSTCSDFFFIQVGDQERGREAWAVNCLFRICPFSGLAKGESSLSFSLELVSWRPPFPSASWLEVRSCFPRSQSCHRWSGDGCLALVPFIANAVVMTNIYLPACFFRSWIPGYKKQIQQVESYQ